MLDQSNLSVQRCRLIFWVECSVGGYLALAKTILSIHFDCDHNEKHSRRCLAVCCIRFTLNICVV
jgi:hypothetical protein